MSSLCHRLFADNTLIFFVRQIQIIFVICVVSSYSPRLVCDIGGLASILGCGVSSLFMKYLGLLLGASYKAKSIWDDIMVGWKMLYLSKGGRLTLIKSILSNLPTYYMSLFLILVGVANQIEQFQRDF